MAENKILVQIIDHDDGDSVLGQDYFESRGVQANLRPRVWQTTW